MANGTSVRIFLANGTPDGLRVVEKSNWIGRAIVCSRAQFSSAKSRPEFNRTGVYLLLGFDDEGQTPIAYIGEGDPVLPRLESHDKNKDFWEQVIVFSSKDENLNKAHIQYLESLLVEAARKANRCKLDNGNSPTKSALSESDIADMETFFAEMRLVFSVLGIKIFDLPKVSPEMASETQLEIKSGSSVIGRGFDKPEGFIVLKGSRCIKREVPSQTKGARALRASLLDRTVLHDVGEFLEFNQDYVFNSPSQAADIMLGRPANGRTEWKFSNGRTLKDHQENEGNGLRESLKREA